MAGSILVVEDEPAIQELVSFACSSGGYEVLRADSVGAAQEVIRQALPDLVILDWMLPDRPGIELLRELRGSERTRGLPIILLTAKGAESDKVAGLDAGADDYVVKPFSPRELVSRVRAVFRRRAPQSSGERLSYGALTIDPSNPKTMWVGTGETWVRNSVSVGDGVYRSTDGGPTGFTRQTSGRGSRCAEAHGS